MRCLHRARRMQSTPRHLVPQGPIWQAIGHAKVLSLERCIAGQPDNALPPVLLAASPPPLSAPGSARTVSASNGVMEARPNMLQLHRSKPAQASKDEYDEDGLRLVYDSAPQGELRAARVVRIMQPC